MISHQADTAVIGGGVIGLAVARELAMRGMEVFVLESEPSVGAHTSSRNSEVVHAGFYYTPGSLKARLCVAGRRALESYVAQNDVGYRRLGKLVVATSDEEGAALEGYRARGVANGVEGLEIIDASQAHALEPEVRCVRALWSPATGIIDSHGLMTALRADLERKGSHVVLRSPVKGGRVRDGGIELAVGGESPTTVRFKRVVNAAGLWAQSVASTLEGMPSSAIPPTHFARGHYFVLDRPSPFHHLVYPLATRDFLGVHVTLDMAGRCRFGPDVEWIDAIHYPVDPARAAPFYAVIRRYWPGLPDGALYPDYAGIRAKITPRGAPAADFVIQGPAAHGVAGLINLYGIESPGLTASLALADRVAAMASERAA